MPADDERNEPRSPAETFGRAARIPGLEGFDHCLQRPPLFRSGAFAFHLVTRDAPGWRLGLVIPKRFVKSAVARNAIKRHWREAFRRSHSTLAREFGGADLVVRLHASLQPRTKPSQPKGGKPMKTEARAQLPKAAIVRIEAAAMLESLATRLRARGFGPDPRAAKSA